MPALPLWPLYVMFGMVPLWWALGGLYLFWPVFTVVLGVVLLSRGRIRMPTGWTLWLMMISLIVISATRLEKITSFIMYGLRLSFVVSAFLIYLYVYNAARSGLSWKRLFQPLMVFWLAMVALGWLGVILPRLALTTPVEMLLPKSISGDRIVQAFTHVHTTEFNVASRNPYFRTAAPFPYTNNWGTGFAVLVPCVVAYLSSVRQGLLRKIVIVSLPLSLVPAFLTLNRGMFIGLGAGLLYLGLRALMRGDVRVIASIIGVALLAWVVTLFIPVMDLITNRVENTDSTRDRADLYWQTLNAVLHSPLLGYGAPRTVDTTTGAEPLGTQGQLWLIMFSHGLPALILFLLIFVLIARRLAVAVSTPGKWLSIIPVIALIMTPFYGYTDPNMSVMFFGIALAMAAVDGPVNRSATTEPATRPPVPRTIPS
ncbi:O-antigen ligase family protein [Actinoplanes sp. TFC3]|uniref:O-antigen ligase family protein n=1 Tax=Actinoplanes sp. TFC3 TaxID=1710355 RepID=UPI000AD60155|nr:O-antigen ligase family protein [Actinoplanes sp. TFC3]